MQELSARTMTGRLVAGVLLITVAASGCATVSSTIIGRVPVYVTPIYYSEPLQVNVGKRSELLLGLTMENAVQVERRILEHFGEVNIETMYVLATRLYDVGLKDRSVYWFYTAQLYARVFTASLDPDHVGGLGSQPFELKHAFNAFNQLVGEFINGYGFGDIDQLIETLKQVIADHSGDSGLTRRYPKIRFVEQSSIDHNKAEIIDGLTELIEYADRNREMIYEERKKNGIEGKY